MVAALAMSWGQGRKTASAGTKINYIVPPKGGKRTKLTAFSVTNGATAHTLTVMRPLGKTTLSAAAAAAATTVVLTRDPGAYAANATADGFSWTPSVADNLIASGDYIAIKRPDGTWFLTTVGTCTTGSDGTVSCASVTVPTGGLLAGATVFFFGINTDTDPRTGEAHPIYTIPASGITSLNPQQGPITETLGQYEPLVVQENNATNAAVVEMISGIYAP